jgi:hypothetical protein
VQQRRKWSGLGLSSSVGVVWCPSTWRVTSFRTTVAGLRRHADASYRPFPAPGACRRYRLRSGRQVHIDLTDGIVAHLDVAADLACERRRRRSFLDGAMSTSAAVDASPSAMRPAPGDRAAGDVAHRVHIREPRRQGRAIDGDPADLRQACFDLDRRGLIYRDRRKEVEGEGAALPEVIRPRGSVASGQRGPPPKPNDAAPSSLIDPRKQD